MTLSTTALSAPEPNTFLTVNDVFARYGWKKSAGYEYLKAAGFPRPLPGGRYRLDVLMDWERSHMTAAVPAEEAADNQPKMPSGPPPKRTGGRRAKPAGDS